MSFCYGFFEHLQATCDFANNPQRQDWATCWRPLRCGPSGPFRWATTICSGRRSSWSVLNGFWSEPITADFKGLIDVKSFILKSACFPDLALGPRQTLALRCLSKIMPSIGRVYILTRWFLEVKSHSCSSDLNELSLGLRMDVIRVARDPFPSRQPCQPMGGFQTSC